MYETETREITTAQHIVSEGEVDGFDVNAHDDRGMGILSYAMQKGLPDVIRWLNSHGISEDEMYGCDDFEQCAIYWAAEKEAVLIDAILEFNGYSFLENTRRFRHPNADHCRDPLVSAVLVRHILLN